MGPTILSLSENLADFLLDVVFLISSDGVILDISAGCERMLG
jgi:hypothetical protein